MNSELVYRVIKCYINEYAAPETSTGTTVTPFFLKLFSKKTDIKYGAHTMFRAYSQAKGPSYYLNMLSSPVKSPVADTAPVPGAPNEAPLLLERIHVAAVSLIRILKDIPCSVTSDMLDISLEIEKDLSTNVALGSNKYGEIASKIDKHLASNKSDKESLERFNLNVAYIQYSELLKCMDEAEASIKAGFPKVTHFDGAKLRNPYDVAAGIAGVIYWASKIYADSPAVEPKYYIKNTEWTFNKLNDMLDDILSASISSPAVEKFLAESDIPLYLKCSDTITREQEIDVSRRLSELKDLLVSMSERETSSDYTKIHSPGQIAKKALAHNQDSDTILSCIFEAIDDCAKIIKAEIVA